MNETDAQSSGTRAPVQSVPAPFAEHLAVLLWDSAPAVIRQRPRVKNEAPAVASGRGFESRRWNTLASTP